MSGAKLAPTPQQVAEARRYAELSDDAAMIPARMVKRAFAVNDALVEASQRLAEEVRAIVFIESDEAIQAKLTDLDAALKATRGES